MDVLSLGIFVVDVIGRPVDNFPEEGGLEVFDELEIHAGGGANNTGIGLAKLGIDVGAAGRIGYSITESLLSLGSKVIACDLNTIPLIRLQKQFNNAYLYIV